MASGLSRDALQHALDHVFTTSRPRQDVTAFAAAGGSSKVVRGRNREGEACTCTDPPPAKADGGGSPTKPGSVVLQTIGIQKAPPVRDHDEVAEEFAKQQRAAAVFNADAAVEKPAEEFAQARAVFGDAFKDTKMKFDMYKDQREKYELAYNAAMGEHKRFCQPFVDDHFQIPMDCERRRRKEAWRFLARMRHPECMVGGQVTLDTPQEAGAPLHLLVAAFSRDCAFVRTTDVACQYTPQTPSLVASFL
eukprot:TRINITY_DN83095_c0_g1_i1.p1 TRINITY_DN83095_c0_g1~~TRINITY_DN83095_c0_g1_i1.p1  ORF type:complete len:249 (+),score=55.60 TRINITY_DN83095_c0_g1_i1:155-901(+)